MSCYRELLVGLFSNTNKLTKHQMRASFAGKTELKQPEMEAGVSEIRFNFSH